MAIQGSDKDPVGSVNVLSPAEKVERITARAVEFAYGLARERFQWFEKKGAKPDYLHQHDSGRVEQHHNMQKLDRSLIDVQFDIDEEGLVGYSVGGHELTLLYSELTEGVSVPAGMYYQRGDGAQGRDWLCIYTKNEYIHQYPVTDRGLRVAWDIKPYNGQTGPWGAFSVNYINTTDLEDWDTVRLDIVHCRLDNLLFDITEIADWFIPSRELGKFSVKSLLEQELAITMTPRYKFATKFPRYLDIGHGRTTIFGRHVQTLQLNDELRALLNGRTNVNGYVDLSKDKLEVTHGIMATNNPTQYVLLPYLGQPAFVEICLDGVTSHKKLQDGLENMSEVHVSLRVRRDGEEQNMQMLIRIPQDGYFMDRLAGGFACEFLTNSDFMRLLCGDE